MPTTRPRHLITESDSLAVALNDAAQRWPELKGSRAKLLVRLVEEGHRALTSASEEEQRARATAVMRTSGVATGAYEPGYLERLREDWPE